MYGTVLVLLVTTFCVDSLSVMSYNSIFIVNMPEEDNRIIEEPPPHGQVAKMARYVVHVSNYTVLAYKSQHTKTKDFPMGTIVSVSDGTVEKSVGTPYMYVTRLEDVVQDTEIDSRCSLTMSLAQGDYCRQKELDPQSPVCAQVTLVGRLEKVKNGSAEQSFAKLALFSRHPSMKTWPEDHHFFIVKLNIEQVVVQDYFGGPVYVSVEDYYKATPQ
ncbi:protein CREG1-like [Periplaneta americana]|uniref:protein CREG1-like n=1 Tax=Periplaneta americana TaxID=6978 RepID=UPI0037E9B716